MVLYWSSVVAGVVCVVGCGYLVAATFLTDRFACKALSPRRTSMPGVTILKPLHGAEPGLLENLASFCAQNYPGPVQIVLGVQDPGDDALAVVERFRAEHAACHIDLVIDATMHGLNRKVSNLVNMCRRVDHDIVVVADSDMRVDPDYLSRVVGALEQRGVGAVTCLYHGFAATGLWAQLFALGINAHFLPSVVVGRRLGLAQPCFGSTIAFKRKALAEIGGFIGVANCLADDYAIGAALRAQGYKISIPPISIGHVCGKMSAQELWQREVRWARTIRSIEPVGYAGSIVTHVFPWALIAALAGIAPECLGPATALGACIASLGCRVVLLWRVERTFGLPRQSYCLIPLRDLLSLVVFVFSFFGRTARWKGRRYSFASDGTLVVVGSSSP